jgi:citrate synthase
MDNAKLHLSGNDYELPAFAGSEDETAVDISKLRAQSGAITYDPGYGNTGSCKSAITFINGEKGILRYRGYPIEQLAEHSSFSEVAYLLIYGELPDKTTLQTWREDLAQYSFIHEKMTRQLEHFPLNAHPMGVLASLIAAMSTYYPSNGDETELDINIRRLLGQVKTFAAYSYKQSIGAPFVYPKRHLGYSANFLWLMFGTPAEEYVINPVLDRAMNILFILHADHEQNCSASTVRMAGSSQADLYASISAGIGALSGPLHGGANQEVIEMLERIRDDGGNLQKYVDLAKKKDGGFRLMGFGHRVYKNFDPRAKIIKRVADEVLKELGVDDPLLDLAKQLEEVALKDEFFIERKLYPNVDFYSGIIYRAMGFPVNIFTALFAIGRMPGWIAHWLEMRADPDTRIHRPRQIYTGPTVRDYPKGKETPEA